MNKYPIDSIVYWHGLQAVVIKLVDKQHFYRLKVGQVHIEFTEDSFRYRGDEISPHKETSKGLPLFSVLKGTKKTVYSYELNTGSYQHWLYTVEMWKEAVNKDNTRRGYWSWVTQQHPVSGYAIIEHGNESFVSPEVQ